MPHRAHYDLSYQAQSIMPHRAQSRYTQEKAAIAKKNNAIKRIIQNRLKIKRIFLWESSHINLM